MQLSNELHQLISQEIIADIDTLNSKDGLSVFEIKGYLTNSKYNPVKEAKRICEGNYKKHHYHILLGIGAGYIADELYLKLNDHERLLIIEPNEKLLERANGLQCIRDIEKVSIISGLRFEQLEKYLSSVVTEYNNRIQFIISPNYDKLYPHFIKQVMLIIKEILMLEIVNRNTLRKFANNWQENFINNLYFAYQSIPFSLLNKKLACPIVIASGGPSLIKQLPLIKNNRSKFFLLCAGSTINTLLTNGIVPDGIVVIDGSDGNLTHFKNIKDFNIPLFYSTMLYKDILRLHTGKKIVFNNKGHSQSGKVIDSLLNYEVGEVIGGGSVANFSLDIAYKLTSGPICLVGQDLAYTGNVSHAKGNKNFAMIDEKIMKERKMFKINGYYGEKVLTDYSLLSMKKGFELYLDYVSQRDGIKRVYNCTEGGAVIEGYENLSFSTFLNKFCENQIIKDFNKLLNEMTVEKTTEQWKGLHDFISNEKHKSEKVYALCTESLDILSKLNQTSSNFTNKVIKSLDKLDNQLQNLLKNELLFYLFQEVIFNVNNHFLEKETETHEEAQKRIYLKSSALYEGIQTSSQRAITWYEELLDNISKEMNME